MTQASATFPPTLEAALSEAEAGMQRSLETLAAQRSADLPSLVEQLVQSLRVCAHAAQSAEVPTQATQLRLQALGAQLGQLQGALLRHQAQVAQQLRVLLPSVELSTYGPGASAYVPGRSSAATFTSLSA